MPPKALTSTYEKLRRAENQLGSLEKSVERWANRNLIEIDVDRDYKQRVRVRITKVPEIPRSFHLRIGECVHNFRSALDHLAYQLNVLGSGDPPRNWKRSQFPVFDNGPKYRARSGPMIRHVPRGARTRFERLQPYHRRKDPDLWRLDVLHELSVIDKHRHFPLSVASMPGVAFTVHGGRITDRHIETGPLEAGAQIAWFECPDLSRDAKPQVDLSYFLTVEFNKGVPPLGLPLILDYEPVTLVLGEIRDYIRADFLPRFESFF